eukprot:CAMPEP_0179208262 /NCGR_PEP_ID=MMETSP0796-20121207/103860_1 /TAXON_ID=73915 /ORGANISM="Pyrodinium bahamense, Strain pbaha01" /LENGTH=250 /DNA_ID=CAMNT_0020913209 /DNA_START=32 /DNA_END=784 /DNA_ORIENTATION=+
MAGQSFVRWKFGAGNSSSSLCAKVQSPDLRHLPMALYAHILVLWSKLFCGLSDSGKPAVRTPLACRPTVLVLTLRCLEPLLPRSLPGPWPGGPEGGHGGGGTAAKLSTAAGPLGTAARGLGAEAERRAPASGARNWTAREALSETARLRGPPAPSPLGAVGARALPPTARPSRPPPALGPRKVPLPSGPAALPMSASAPWPATSVASMPFASIPSTSSPVIPASTRYEGRDGHNLVQGRMTGCACSSSSL